MIDRYDLEDCVHFKNKYGKWCEIKDVEPLIEALRFYADIGNWQPSQELHFNNKVEMDVGKKAREALKKIGE